MADDPKTDLPEETTEKKTETTTTEKTKTPVEPTAGDESDK